MVVTLNQPFIDAYPLFIIPKKKEGKIFFQNIVQVLNDKLQYKIYWFFSHSHGAFQGQLLIKYYGKVLNTSLKCYADKNMFKRSALTLLFKQK